MDNPGSYSLASLALTTPMASVALTPITELAGMNAASFDIRFSYGSGGNDCRVYLQTTFDSGVTWIDIACFLFTVASARQIINLSALDKITAPVTPTDGSMADNTVQDGLLGDALRVKILSTGTYLNTALNVSAVVR